PGGRVQHGVSALVFVRGDPVLGRRPLEPGGGDRPAGPTRRGEPARLAERRPLARGAGATELRRHPGDLAGGNTPCGVALSSGVAGRVAHWPARSRLDLRCPNHGISLVADGAAVLAAGAAIRLADAVVPGRL